MYVCMYIRKTLTYLYLKKIKLRLFLNLFKIE